MEYFLIMFGCVIGSALGSIGALKYQEWKEWRHAKAHIQERIKSLQEQARRDGLKCPRCDSDDIRIEERSAEKGCIIVVATCAECGWIPPEMEHSHE